MRPCSTNAANGITSIGVSISRKDNLSDTFEVSYSRLSNVVFRVESQVQTSIFSQPGFKSGFWSQVNIPYHATFSFA